MTRLQAARSEFFKRFGRLLYDAIRSVEHDEIPQLLKLLSHEHEVQGLIDRIHELEMELQKRKAA